MQEERTGWRGGAYSAWHRRHSIRRFVGIEAAQLLSMVDVDCALWVEADDACREPLALVETAFDVGQEYKAATVIAALARLAKLPAFVCLYSYAARPNPANPRFPDLEAFRVKRLWPTPQSAWRVFSPAEWAQCLLAMRRYSAAFLDRAQAQADHDAGAAHWIEAQTAKTLELLPS